MTKTLKDFMEVYKPKSPDEQKFVDKHVTIKHSDRNGNGDDVFKATNIKTIKRKEERKGYDPGDDEKVYEALKGDQHKIDANKNGKVDAHDFHLLRKKKKVAEEVEEVEEARIYPGDYHVTSEKSQFGGHRPKVVHKDKGHTMYLGQHAYKKPAMAIKHGEAYLTAYAARGDRAADNASIDFARANKKHLYVKEDIDIENVLDEALDLLMSIDEKTLTPAEMKKREEVVKAIKRGNPKMDKSMAYAIATKTAKRVAEGKIPTNDEPDYDSEKTADKVRRMLAKEKKPVKEDVEEIDEISKATMGRYINRAKDQIDTASYRQGHRDSRGSGGDAVGKGIERKLSKRHGGIELAVKKLTKEETEDLDESAKVAAHLIKRYGDNVRKSHVRSAANDFGVDPSKLAKAVRTKLGKTSLAEEEQIDELSKSTLGSYAKKAMKDAPEKDRMGKAFSDLAGDDAKRGDREGASYYGKRAAQSYTKAANRRAGVEKAIDKLTKEETQIDEISAKKLTDYTAKASDARGHRDMPTAKLDKRYKSMALAHEKIRARHAKVPANEEVEHIDELSKKTLGNYTYKAASELGSKGITTGLKIAADEPTEKNFKKLANRQKGVASAVKRLTKEDIINRSVEKYVPEELKFTPEERLLKRLDGLSEAHVKTLLGLFEALNKDNQNRMIETVETREGINQLLNFALENRGE